MKVLRSLFVAAVAVGAAACGDKVTVAGPATTDTTPRINSVSVAPSTAVMAVGQTVSFSAVVDASNGAATTVTWSPTTGPVTVSSAGLATASAATPGVAVCATSTVDPNKKGCASVVVSGGSTGGGTTPATISIASITGAGGLNFPVPVPPGAVGTGTPTGGQLDVRMNLTTNSLIAEEVDVMVDDTLAAKQSFTAAAAAALVAQSIEPSTDANVSTVIISLAINACKSGTNRQVVCGSGSTTPSWLNGPHKISAKVVGHYAGAANGSTTASAGQQIQLLYANASGFIGTVTIAGANNASAAPTSPAVDGAGYKWQAGAMTVKGVPIIYTGQTAKLANISFNNFACSGGGVRTSSNIAAASDGSFTATFSGTSNTAPSVRTYEMNPATCANATLLAAGEAPNISSTGSDNDAIVLAAGGTNGGAGFLNSLVNLNADPALSIRLDNVTPGTGTACTFNTTASAAPDGFDITVNGRTNGWLNGGVTLNRFATGTSPDRLGANVAGNCSDLGVGRLGGTDVVYSARVGLVTADDPTVDAVEPSITSVAGLNETSSGRAMRLRFRAADKLGNTRNLTVGDFGVDLTPPTLTLTNANYANGRFAAMPANYIFSALDVSNPNPPVPPAAAPSGVINIGATPNNVSFNRRDAVNGNLFWCASGANYRSSSSTTCASWDATTFNAGQILGGVPVDPSGTNLDAYYTVSAYVFDQAGNPSVASAMVNTLVVDATVPNTGGVLFPPGLSGNSTVLFTSAAADNLDIQSVRLSLLGPAAYMTGAPFGFTCTFGAPNCSTFRFPDQAVNGFNATPLITSQNVNFTLNNFRIATELSTAATGAVPGCAAPCGNQPVSATVFAVNQANNASVGTVAAFAGGLATAKGITNNGTIVGLGVNMEVGPSTFQMQAINPAGPLSKTAAGGAPTATTFSVIATGVGGATAGVPNFPNPFATVQFWVYNDGNAAGTDGWRLVGQNNNASVIDGGGVRTWTWNGSYAATDLNTPVDAVNNYIIAIGVTPSGTGVVSNAVVVIVNP